MLIFELHDNNKTKTLMLGMGMGEGEGGWTEYPFFGRRLLWCCLWKKILNFLKYVFRTATQLNVYKISSVETSQNFHETEKIHKISLQSVLQYGNYLKASQCPGNIGYFHQDLSWKYLSTRQLLIDDGKSIEIYDKTFCIEEFYDPSASVEYYASVLMCQDAVPSLTFPRNSTTDVKGCDYSVDISNFYRKLRFAYTACGCFSFAFLLISLFLYLTLPGELV